MKSNFNELWGVGDLEGSRAFRQMFIHNGIFSSANEVDVGKAEALWWDRHPLLYWDFCGHDGCRRLAIRGERCQEHMPPGRVVEWKWHSGVLYRWRSVEHRVSGKDLQGREYQAYHLIMGLRVFGEIDPGYSVYYVDGNPFNLRAGNLVLVSNVMLPAIRAGVISVAQAQAMDDVLADTIKECCGRGRRKLQWLYTLHSIAEATKLRPAAVRKAVSEGRLDPGDLSSVAAFCYKHRRRSGGSLSKMRKIG